MLYAAICVLIITSYSAVGAQENTCNETADCLSCIDVHGCVFWICIEDSVFTNVSQCLQIPEVSTLPCIYGGIMIQIDHQQLNQKCPVNKDKEHSTNGWKIFGIILLAILCASPLLIYGYCQLWQRCSGRGEYVELRDSGIQFCVGIRDGCVALCNRNQQI